MSVGDPSVSAYFERIPSRDAFGLWAYRALNDGRVEVLGPAVDGSSTVTVVDAGEVGPGPALVVPGRWAQGVASALAAWWYDRAPDPGTEARVLREALELERRRVDDVLARFGRP